MDCTLLFLYPVAGVEADTFWEYSFCLYFGPFL